MDRVEIPATYCIRSAVGPQRRTHSSRNATRLCGLVHWSMHAWLVRSNTYAKVCQWLLVVRAFCCLGVIHFTHPKHLQLDGFGHSRTEPLLKVMGGFTSLFFGRADFADMQQRRSRGQFEMVWRGSQAYGAESDLWMSQYPTGEHASRIQLVCTCSRNVSNSRGCVYGSGRRECTLLLAATSCRWPSTNMCHRRLWWSALAPAHA